MFSIDNKMGEPNYCPLTPATQGKWVLVTKDHVIQVADHDFSKISWVPTVILLHDIKNF